VVTVKNGMFNLGKLCECYSLPENVRGQRTGHVPAFQRATVADEKLVASDKESGPLLGILFRKPYGDEVPKVTEAFRVPFWHFWHPVG
jgi:hypothetical protein